MIQRLVWLIPLLPMFAAAWIAIGYLAGSNRGEQGEGQTSRVSLLAAGGSLLLVLLLDLNALATGVLPGEIGYGRWFSSGEYRIDVSFNLDLLGLAMANLVTLISLLVLRFSVNYMHREAGYQRFFMIMNLFLGGMLLIVISGNAVLTFVGWELAGLSSYLLIGYAYERDDATGNAVRAFVTNRIGDAAFIVSLFFAFFWIGSVEWRSIISESEALPTLKVGLVTVGFLVAALAKSAQVPFSPWLSRALEGPTPSSAIFYGALLSHAGVYLVIRLGPVIEQVPLLMLLLLILGLLTALYGYLCSLVQTDVKSALIFSASGQLGLMFLFCGLGWFQLATLHLFAHAIWRAYQFLHAPAYMHLVDRPVRQVPAWLSGRNRLYVASLQRFWLDHLADSLLVKPTRQLARDAREFDDKVVNRLIGMPSKIGGFASLSEWEAHADQQGRAEGDIGKGRGLAGKLMQVIAEAMHWFEERLVLHGGGEGMLKMLQYLGGHLLKIEHLLSQPRYLLLLIMLTFVVII